MSVPTTREPKKVLISQIIHQWVGVFRDFRPLTRQLKLFAESLSQEEGVDLYPPARVATVTVFDVAKHSELIHEEAHARACRADHRRQGTLRYSGNAVQLAPIPPPGEQQKSTGESPLTTVRNLVD